MDGLDFRTGGPIYSKLKDTLRNHIISGVYGENERIPSVRELASSLSVNPNTISRAYRELEEEGYIYTVQGKGSFVCGKRDIDEKRVRMLTERLKETVKELCFLGMSAEKLHELIDEEREKK